MFVFLPFHFLVVHALQVIVNNVDLPAILFLPLSQLLFVMHLNFLDQNQEVNFPFGILDLVDHVTLVPFQVDHLDLLNY